MSEHIFDQKWNTASLLRFAFPTIVMMVFMGLYTIVDTIFVARFVSTDALSAINIVCPVINLTVGLGTMIAAGGSAVVSRKMGAGLEHPARPGRRRHRRSDPDLRNPLAEPHPPCPGRQRASAPLLPGLSGPFAPLSSRQCDTDRLRKSVRDRR